jgi:mannosyl-3-phosphoglycerate phosphatase
MKKLIIFTDLDGTLLDHTTYSFAPAMPALEMINKHNIPLIICSSKTKNEIEHYRKKLDNNYPFISENGGGIFIPRGTFDFDIQEYCCSGKKHFSASVSDIAGKGRFHEEGGYHIISFGASYVDLRKAIAVFQAGGFKIKGFGDMSAKEVSERTGLSIFEAGMAKQRYFDEPFFFEGKEKKTRELLAAIKAKGFNSTQGRLFHILGDNDKGKSVAMLIELYKKQFGKIITSALGDSPNDMPMLKLVDCPIIVKKPDGTYVQIKRREIMKTDGIGPEGWNQAVLNLINTMNI